MSDLRQAASFALTTLQGWSNHDHWLWPQSALAQAKQNTTEAIPLLEAALAEPEPEGPTEIEIASILKAYAVIEPQMGVSRILHEKHFSNAARAILARLGNHQETLTSSMPQPIPVIKRRPGLEDCDAEGRCWWGAPAYPDLASASWRFVSAKDRFSSELYWLPANALPQPS